LASRSEAYRTPGTEHRGGWRICAYCAFRCEALGAIHILGIAGARRDTCIDKIRRGVMRPRIRARLGRHPGVGEQTAQQIWPAQFSSTPSTAV
jgi:hypothetical protein